jgi:hypothetical protein
LGSRSGFFNAEAGTGLRAFSREPFCASGILPSLVPGIPTQSFDMPNRCAISSHMASDLDLKAEIERLRAENEAQKKPTRGQISLKVSEKGALSVYGLGRFPVTLYREQWEKLLAMADEIRTFIRANDAALKKKE